MYKINTIATEEHPYTHLLSNLAKMPKRLRITGSLPESRQPSVAIVGARKLTPYGKEVTYRLSFELAKRGIVIISGLALGTDGVAHQAALDAGGTTIAVLPTAIESIHPRTHRQLAENIVRQGGALVTEYQPTDFIGKGNFVARNRIVSGLSDALLITEAAAKSGTLITANYALEQGKSVMTVPGNITSPYSVGCNNLLKIGATPITGVQDVLHELGLQDIGEQTSLPLAATAEQDVLLRLLGEGIKEGELLHTRSGLTATSFSETMTMLEIEGKIRSLGANQWAIRR